MFEKRSRIGNVILISMYAFILGSVIYLFVPRETMLHLGYQIIPICWRCTDSEWRLEDGRTVAYRLPSGWQTTSSDDNSQLVLSPVEGNLSFVSISTYLPESNGTDIDVEIAGLIDRSYAAYRNYSFMVEPQLGESKRHQFVYAKLAVEPYINMSQLTESVGGRENLAEVLEPESIESFFKLIILHQVYLIDFEGTYIMLLHQSGPESKFEWYEDQAQMIIDSILQGAEE